MLWGIFQYSKASQNAGIHVAPQNLMTSWQAHKGHISSTTRNQRLMKSHRRFLRPGKRQYLQAFTIGETHTLASPPLCCIQSSAWCILLSIFDRNMHWCHETEWSSCCFVGNSTQKLLEDFLCPHSLGTLDVWLLLPAATPGLGLVGVG